MFRVNFSHMESAFPSSIRTSAHAPAQTGEEQSNHCYLDEGFTRLYFSLVILASSTAREKATQMLALRSIRRGLNAEAACSRRALGDLQVPVALSKAPLGQLLPSGGRIRPDLFETRQHRGESSEQAPGPSTIVQIGRGDVDREQQAERIYEDMTLASFHALMRIKTTDPGRFLDGLDADVASMIAALGCAFLPTRSRSASRRASRPSVAPASSGASPDCCMMGLLCSGEQCLGDLLLESLRCGV